MHNGSKQRGRPVVLCDNGTVADRSLRCPICGEETNSSGRPFSSEWAVATHNAGKLKHGWRDRIHRGWARRHVPNFDRSISIVKLADDLPLPIHEAIEADKRRAKPVPLNPQSIIGELERLLHTYVRYRLEQEHGTDGEAWWVSGVPLGIREECVKRREGDPERQEPYVYTYLIDLKKIIEANWRLFESDFARVQEVVGSKKDFLSLLERLNETRNRYAHPVRAPEPDSEKFREDVIFLSDLVNKIQGFFVAQ